MVMGHQREMVIRTVNYIFRHKEEDLHVMTPTEPMSILRTQSPLLWVEHVPSLCFTARK
ncbi:Hypothetical protein FKW44_006877 [Caligus rogercresseyi]|uniref:Uncharacterized protein n=1 Tax=Caligus rogercresseyi TaxID=217165 RepID=A0A7T8KDY5_CALRO|nr:Hypothetical protein FKW44_006877 [Caligus rogercresseyi]